MDRGNQQSTGRSSGAIPAAWLLAAWEWADDALIILDERCSILHANATARRLIGPFTATLGASPWPPAASAGFARLASGQPVQLIGAGGLTATGRALAAAGPEGAVAMARLSPALSPQSRPAADQRRSAVSKAAPAALLRIYQLALSAPGFVAPWDALLDAAARALRAPGVVWMSRRRGALLPERWHGPGATRLATGADPVLEDLAAPVLRSRRPRYLPEAKLAAAHAAPLKAAGLRSLLVLPVLAAGNVSGALLFLGARRDAFPAAVRRHAGLVAQSLGTLVENERLFRYIEATGGKAERERLAAELHDGVVQDLYGLQLALEDLSDRVIAWTDPAATLAQVQQVARQVDGILAELRRTIANLNQSGELAQGLISALRASVLNFTRETGIRTRLDVAVGDDEVVALPLSAKAQVLRVILEALANVRKHAAASRVRVRVEELPTYYRFSVADNGQGFDPAAVAEGHFGLQIMKERAAAIDSLLTVASHPGKGTLLSLAVPRPGQPAAAAPSTGSAGDGQAK